MFLKLCCGPLLGKGFRSADPETHFTVKAKQVEEGGGKDQGLPLVVSSFSFICSTSLPGVKSPHWHSWIILGVSRYSWWTRCCQLPVCFDRSLNKQQPPSVQCDLCAEKLFSGKHFEKHIQKKHAMPHSFHPFFEIFVITPVENESLQMFTSFKKF